MTCHWLLAVHGEGAGRGLRGVVICGGRSWFVNSGHERDEENALIKLSLSFSV